MIRECRGPFRSIQWVKITFLKKARCCSWRPRFRPTAALSPPHIDPSCSSRCGTFGAAPKHGSETTTEWHRCTVTTTANTSLRSFPPSGSESLPFMIAPPMAICHRGRHSNRPIPAEPIRADRRLSSARNNPNCISRQGRFGSRLPHGHHRAGAGRASSRSRPDTAR